MASTTVNSFTLSAEEQARLAEILRAPPYQPLPTPHTTVAARGQDVTVALYTSGKCVVQGKGAADFVTFVLEPLVLQRAVVGYEDVINPQGIAPHLGVDESGKGDFFGPLVIAAAYVDPDLAPPMRALGVRDSKQIGSDARAMAIGAELRRLLGNRYTVIRINPPKYNELYSRMRSVNTLLSWGHARAIENVLDAVPDCPRAISDQFGNPAQVKRALMARGRAIELEQRHRAESDLAVAAASILAREGFLIALRELAQRYESAIPKGASPQVRAAAETLVRAQGPKVLIEAAKCHFKTADEVLAACGAARADLGPLGAAVSQSQRPDGGGWRRHASASP